MKYLFWLKRNDVVLINLSVIGLMLWLTVSFLLLAISGRNQAQQLQSSVTSQAAIYNAETILIDEFNYFRSDGSTFSDAPRNSVNRLQQTREASLIAVQKMMDALDKQIAHPDFDLRSRRSGESIRKLKDQLSQQLTHFDDVQQTLLQRWTMQGSPEKLLNNSIEGTQQLAENARINFNETMIALSYGVSYLPDNNAYNVSAMQEMLFESTAIRHELSRYAVLLEMQEADIQSGIAPLLVQLQKSLLSRLDTVDYLSAGVELFKQDNQILQELKSGIVNNLFAEPLESEQLESDQQVDSADELTDEGVQVLIGKLVQQTDEHAELTINNLKNVAAMQVERGTRDIIIYVVLVLLCFLIAFTTALLHRRIKSLAYNDKLTGLSNRVSFEHWLLKAFNKNMSQKQALIYIDLDRFKAVNDNYGHDIGDELLKVVAGRLTPTVRPNAVVARLGGDEFAVFIQNLDTNSQVMRIATELVELIEQDIVIGDHVLRVGASAGVSIFPDDSVSGIELLKNADVAMYHSKASKQKSVFRYSAEIADSYQKRLAIELELKDALKKDQFKLVYQPKVCTQSGEVGGVEALIRWVHDDWGVVSPADFIPVAEDMGLMGDIGNWVLNKACLDIAQFQATHNVDIHVAVNISAQQFNDVRFEGLVYNALQASGLDRQHLELEVTESLLLDDAQRVISMLHSLKSNGIKIAIDDFGTGYSSLQYLQQLPLSTLKIDRAFIVALENSDPAESVANSIVQLANLFNLETVAEGVETREQDEKIRSLGVQYIQGYRYSKPVPISELAGVVSEVSSKSDPDSTDNLSRVA